MGGGGGTPLGGTQTCAQSFLCPTDSWLSLKKKWFSKNKSSCPIAKIFQPLIFTVNKVKFSGFQFCFVFFYYLLKELHYVRKWLFPDHQLCEAGCPGSPQAPHTLHGPPSTTAFLQWGSMARKEGKLRSQGPGTEKTPSGHTGAYVPELHGD